MPREFKINITTTTDSAGARQAASDLDNLGKKATEAGDKGKEAAGKMFEKNSELRRLLQGMGETAIPGVGAAFGELALGPVGIILGLVSITELLKSSLEDSARQLDAIAEKASHAFGDRWQAARDVAKQLAEDASRFNLSMRDTSTVTDAIKRDLQDSNDSITANTSAIREELKAAQDLELALHPENADAIKAKFANLNRDTTQAERVARIQADQAAYNSARSQQAGLEAETQTKREAEREPATRLLELQGQIKSLEDDRAEIKKDAAANDEKLQKQVETAERNLAAAKEDAARPHIGHAPETMVSELQKEIDRLKSEFSGVRLPDIDAKIKTLDGQLTAAQIRADAAKADADAADSRARQNKDFYTQLAPKLSGEVRQEAVIDQGDQTTARIEALTRAMQGAGRMTSQQVAEQGIDELILSHVRDERQDNSPAARRLRDLLSASGYKDEAIVRILNDLITHHATQQKVLGDIAAQIARLNSTLSQVQSQVSAGSVLNHR